MTDLRDPSGGQMIGSETGGWGPAGSWGGVPLGSSNPSPPVSAGLGMERAPTHPCCTSLGGPLNLTYSSVNSPFIELFSNTQLDKNDCFQPGPLHTAGAKL